MPFLPPSCRFPPRREGASHTSSFLRFWCCRFQGELKRHRSDYAASTDGFVSVRQSQTLRIATPYYTPFSGHLSRGWQGFPLETTPIIPHFGGICQGVGRDFPLKPPLLYPISGAFVKGLAGIFP
jgi:hypothetical protein